LEHAQALAAHEADRPPRLWAEGRFLSEVFLELRAAQSSGGFAPNPISWTELRAFRKERGLKKFSLWALRLLRMADSEYLKWAEAEAEAARAKAS
jgi:hypothetical protein